MRTDKTNIIVGPPGTGKTHRLLEVVESYIASGTSPSKIGFISFTKKAAEEGKSRACAKFDLQENELPHFKTIHAMAFKYLGMRREQVFGWNHTRELGKMLGMDFKGRGMVSEEDVYGMGMADRMLFLEGLAKNTQVTLKDTWNKAAEDSIDWFELERFAKSMTLFKKARMLYDFNDILERFAASDFRTFPKFELLVIDEAQDLSNLQWKCVDMLAENAGAVFVAGDDDQAIYRWSGANVEKFIELEGDVKVLDQSHRIPHSVFGMAESISSMIGNRRPKAWSSRIEKGAVNWSTSAEDVDISKGTWLLLARNGYMLDKLEEWCLSQGFSFHSINRDPLKSAALQAVRIWENLRRGRDESAERILDVCKYLGPGIAPATMIKRLKADDAASQYSMPELEKLGLQTTKIWHEALVKISAKERDFFLAARRRGEALLKEPRIKISTIHAAKGGEADHVLLPTDMSYRCHTNMQENFDDEARVWYVAATRCRQTLNLVMPETNLNFEM